MLVAGVNITIKDEEEEKPVGDAVVGKEKGEAQEEDQMVVIVKEERDDEHEAVVVKAKDEKGKKIKRMIMLCWLTKLIMRKRWR
ncbi:Hypothetical predicted protein [Prunus dulcis]|uniref:Uncharacterized protein n=1 Tax=Prunus dulcis TaxID=3755 RepID=A0A5E4G0T5_PRUDU|nr:hypothetical protein L3X38_018506 [Prunus dulcis]VVA33326.1 Hypothetical predicted protein [Prunus dulcis]